MRTIFELISLLLITALFSAPASVALSSDLFDKPPISNNYPNAHPDLSWLPQEFVPFNTPNARYIDYQNGLDSNPGTKEKPWKHHPWDPNAASLAANSDNIFTFYFKRGVIYRGSLNANTSGTPLNPIRLTIDPDWGAGDATLSGSIDINDEWHLCSADEQTSLPNSSRGIAWCTNIRIKAPPRNLWVRIDGNPKKVTIARTPNWTVKVPDDPRSEWFTLEDIIIEINLETDNSQEFSIGDHVVANAASKPEGRIIDINGKTITIETQRSNLQYFSPGKSIFNGKTTSLIKGVNRGFSLFQRIIDKRHLSAKPPGHYTGATIYVEPAFIPQPVAGTVLQYDPVEASLRTNLKLTSQANPLKDSRYFIEGLPQFLDTDGEYAFELMNNDIYRIYLRLPGDRNPNQESIEVASENTILQIFNKNNIEISGLHFRSSNQLDTSIARALEAQLYASAIQIRGSSSNINIHHCLFDSLPAGIIVYPDRPNTKSVIDHINVYDSIFTNIDGSAIAMGNGQNRKKFSNSSSRLVHTKIVRNWFHNIGILSFGQLGATGTHADAIQVDGGEVVEIAGNHVDRVGGSGINVRLGSTHFSRGNLQFPLLRGLIHHNKVTNTLLTRYDAGGILAWAGGPIYIYNNISGNPVGYRHNSNTIQAQTDTLQKSSYGVGIYLDSNYKAYVFNNIVWGNNSDTSSPIYNAAAINEAMGFNHVVFNNTLYRFAAGLHKGMSQHNRNYYLGNILIDMGQKFIWHKPLLSSIEYESLAFSNNLFHGQPVMFGKFGRGRLAYVAPTIQSWVSMLKEKGALKHTTGLTTESDIVIDSINHDFRLQPDSPAIGYGVNVFVPWSLYKVVGEWNFFQSPSQPTIIFGENININDEWIDRIMLDKIPRNNLVCQHTGPEDFTYGSLETWTKGALYFDGLEQYCKLSNEELTRSYNWRASDHKKSLSGMLSPSKRDTVDMDTNSFLIEAVLETNSRDNKTIILHKRSHRGYELSITKKGKLLVLIDFGDEISERASTISVVDGQWHHIIVEIDRNNPHGINIYIDGTLSNGEWKGNVMGSASLSNNSDFEVGRSGNSYFKGKIDFLRVSKGTLMEAETTINELYNWEFRGPPLKDFSGNSTNGSRNNAGAVE